MFLTIIAFSASLAISIAVSCPGINLIDPSTVPQIDFCTYKPCLNNGTCVTGTPNSLFSCICKLGYSGKVCENACWSNNTLFLTADNILFNVYINGYPVEFDKTFYDNWHVAKSLLLPCDVVTIAMLVENAGSVSGLLVWDSKGFIVSNSHWKCSNVLTIGWMNNLFDDSAWPAAIELAPYGSDVWGTSVTNTNGPGPTSASFWIWFSGSIYDIYPVYCRIKLPKP